MTKDKKFAHGGFRIPGPGKFNGRPNIGAISTSFTMKQTQIDKINIVAAALDFTKSQSLRYIIESYWLQVQSISTSMNLTDENAVIYIDERWRPEDDVHE